MGLKTVIIIALAFVAAATAASEEDGTAKVVTERDATKEEKLVGANSFNLVSTLGHYDQPTPVQAVQEVITPYYANHYTYAKYLVPTPSYGYGHGGHGLSQGYGYGYQSAGYGYGNGHEHSHSPIPHGYLGYGNVIGHILAYNAYRPNVYPPREYAHGHYLPNAQGHGHGHGQGQGHGHGHYNQAPVYYSANYQGHGHGQGQGHHGVRNGNYGHGLTTTYGVPLYNNRQHNRFGLYH